MPLQAPELRSNGFAVIKQYRYIYTPVMGKSREFYARAYKTRAGVVFILIYLIVCLYSLYGYIVLFVVMLLIVVAISSTIYSLKI